MAFNMANSRVDKLPVPKKYMGVWQRQLLETSTIRDESSTVFWMQSQFHHIDIRIPISLNQLRSVNTLDDYNNEELLLLAEQQGFAGITKVTQHQTLLGQAISKQSNVDKDIRLDVCEWLREIDYQPASECSDKCRDISEMNFTDANTVIETGIDAQYLEIWRRLDGSEQPVTHQFITGINRHAEYLPASLIRAGKFVAFARPRTITLPNAESLIQANQTFKPNREALLDWLDMEISFGEALNENEWQIKYSTMPFKKNLILNFKPKI